MHVDGGESPMNPRQLSILLLVVCGLSIWQVTVIPESPMYAAVGATLVPAVVTGLLTVFALAYTVAAFRRKVPDAAVDDPEEIPLPNATQRFAYFFGGCIGFVILIKPLGFLIAGTVAALGIARAFDAALNLKSIILCVAITFSFWLLFDPLLSVDLGPLVIGLK
jgi:putative tricarboxylic transport membrane protein